MKTPLLVGSLTAALFSFTSSVALAQRGVGEATGVARQAVQPEVVTLEGRLTQVLTAPCESTTGRSPIGTHIVLETKEGETLNIHLGPAAEVADVVGKLPVGEAISVAAFRTEKLKPAQYIARAIDVGGERIELRDASLRPTWAPGNARFATSTDTRRGPGPGWRAGGRGPCGQGRGMGMGPGGGGGRRRGWR